MRISSNTNEKNIDIKLLGFGSYYIVNQPKLNSQ